MRGYIVGVTSACFQPHWSLDRTAVQHRLHSYFAAFEANPYFPQDIFNVSISLHILTYGAWIFFFNILVRIDISDWHNPRWHSNQLHSHNHAVTEKTRSGMQLPNLPLAVG